MSHLEYFTDLDSKLAVELIEADRDPTITAEDYADMLEHKATVEAILLAVKRGEGRR